VRLREAHKEATEQVTHDHRTQYYYCLQSMLLWREVLNDMFKCWCIAEADLLNADSPYAVLSSRRNALRPSSRRCYADALITGVCFWRRRYRLTDTGQGLNRVQQANGVYRLMARLLHSVQSKVGHWVGSSVIHLGDTNVPNALMFIDKCARLPLSTLVRFGF
jgi:hypothetical protein